MLSRRSVLAAAVAPALRSQPRASGMFSDAEAYQRFMGRWSTLLAPSFVDFAGIANSGRVLDAGSGTGVLAFAIAKTKNRCLVFGIDPSEEYVGYANSKNTFGDRVHFQVGDAQQLRFSGGMFQHCLSLLVVNFIPDRKKALGELSRVTAAGGSVSAAVWDYSAGMKMLRVFWDAAATLDPAARKSDESHMPLCRAGELAAFWKECGLKQVEERPLDITMRFVSFADYWDPFLLGQGPAGSYLKKIDPVRRIALRNEIKKRLAVKWEGAPFSLPARAWAVRGTV